MASGPEKVIAMNKPLISKWPLKKIVNHRIIQEEESIAREVPLTVILNGQEFATLVCSPADVRELAVGFLASEGVIRTIEDVQSMSINENQGFIYVELKNPQPIAPSDMSKRLIGSCCGKSRQFYFKTDAATAKTVMSKTKITQEQCFRLMKALNARSEIFFETGGVHNAALCHPDKIIAARTDIGRHNALDKLFGYILTNQLNVKDCVIAFSGRISSEVLLKVSKMGIGILLSKSAPTDLALKTAVDLNITVAGFIRESKMNVYTHSDRIICQ